MRRSFLCALTVCALALGLTGCGESKDTKGAGASTLTYGNQPPPKRNGPPAPGRAK